MARSTADEEENMRRLARESLWKRGLGILGIVAAGCAPQVMIRPTIQDSMVMPAPFDKAWGAMIASLSEQSLPVRAVDKASGLANTDMVVFASGVLSAREIDAIAVKPSVFLGTWVSGRYSVSVFAAAVDATHTKVRITAHIEAFEDNLTKTWHACYSKGVIENRLFNAINSKL